MKLLLLRIPPPQPLHRNPEIPLLGQHQSLVLGIEEYPLHRVAVDEPAGLLDRETVRLLVQLDAPSIVRGAPGLLHETVEFRVGKAGVVPRRADL